MPKFFEITELPSEYLILYASLFVKRQLKQICGENDDIDRQLQSKFLNEYTLDPANKNNYVLIRLNTEHEDAFIVRPILKTDFSKILEKAVFLKSLLQSVENI